MLITFSAPSKTFLCGEYLVLTGGPALLVNTTPRFQLTLTPSNADNPAQATHNLPQNSPALRLLQQEASLFEGMQVEFHDPHRGKGGLGASSAQFLLVWMAKEWLRNKNSNSPDLTHLLDSYRQHAWNGVGVKPSGADLIAQVLGNVTFVEGSIKIPPNPPFSKGGNHTFTWPFPDLDFFLIRTSHKIPTHEHLQTLQPHVIKRIAELSHPLLTAALQACKQKNSNLFIDVIQNLAHLLENNHLVLPDTKKLLVDLCQQKFILAAKGCGALGADVLLALCPIKCETAMQQWAQAHGLEIIASTKDLSSGLESGL